MATPDLLHRDFSGAPSRGAVLDLSGVQSRLHAACPYLFLVLALVTSVVIAWSVPPFMGVDEVSHTHRADLTTFGVFVAQPLRSGGGQDAGGPIDPSIDAANAPFERLKFHAERKVRPADQAQAEQVGWADRPATGGFLNTAVYPPVFYLPASGALAAGRLLGWPVTASLRLARTANAATCIMVGFAALLIAGRARLFLFSLLLLPMSVFLYSTLTQDGGLIVAAVLGAALVSRARTEDRPLTATELVGAATAFALVATAKPPYALIGLVILATPGQGSGRWWAAAAAVAAGFGWYAWMAAKIPLPVGGGAEPAAQLARLLRHPWSGVTAALATVAAQWTFLNRSFVGVLGWLDTDLPEPVYPAVWAGLLLTLAAAWSRDWSAASAVVVGVLAATLVGILAALYVSWSPVGSPSVNGLQGRYFLPLAALAPLAFAGGPPLVRGPAGRWLALGAGSWAALVALVSLVLAVLSLQARYYPG